MKQIDEKKLNPRQQLFVDYYCSGLSQIEAYKKAGYKGDPYQEAWKIAGKCKDAINERLELFVQESENIRRQAIIEAREKQIQLMRHAENEFVQLNASKEIIGDPELINIGGQKGNPLQAIIISPAGDKIELDDDPE